jgi:hypothetical protein
MTPASSLWTQLWLPIGLARQSIKRDSLPVQATLSSSTGPVPWPYPALVIVVAAVAYIHVHDIIICQVALVFSPSKIQGTVARA